MNDKGIKKIQARLDKYNSYIEGLIEQYAENPALKDELDKMQTIASTLEFCLNCLDREVSNV